MKLLKHIGFVALLGLVFAQILPWWSVAIAGFAVGFILKNGYAISFFAGLLGIFLVWFGMAMLISWQTGSPLPDRVAQLISPSMTGLGLALVTGLVGGLVSGFGGLAGRAFRK